MTIPDLSLMHVNVATSSCLAFTRCLEPHAGMIEYCYNLKTIALQYARTWLVLDVVSCLPLECIIRAAGVAHSYNLGHLNRYEGRCLIKIFPLQFVSG